MRTNITYGIDVDEVLRSLLPNMVKLYNEFFDPTLTIDDVKEILAINILGVVPDDEIVVVSTNKGEPAVTNLNSRAGQAFNNIVRRILGENVPIMSFDSENNFLSKLKKIFRIGA